MFTFKPHYIAMIAIQVNIAQKYISGLVNAQLDQIFEENTGETNKVTASMQRFGDIVVALNENDILLTAPLKVLLKKGDGLFTAEARGSIFVDLKIAVNISDDLKTSTQTTLEGYRWIEKPRLDIGVFDIPVEKLTDLALKYYDGSICGAIDAKLKGVFQLNQLIDNQILKLKSEVEPHLPEGVYVQVIPKSFYLENFKTLEGQICIKLGMDPILRVSSSDKTVKVKKTFSWVEQLNVHSLGFVHFELEAASLKSILSQHLEKADFGGREVVVNQLELTTGEQFIAVKGELKKPIHSNFSIHTGIYYNEHEEKLYVKGLEIQVKPKSFIHKLGAPIFASFIESQMEELFPMRINEEINKLLTPYKPLVSHQNGISIRADFKRVRLTEVLVSNEGIEGVMAYEDMIIEAQVGEI